MKTAKPYDPLAGRSLTRFQQKLTAARGEAGGDDCWLWPGKPNDNGYGVFGVYENGRTRSRLAHKQAYTQAVGEVSAGLLVRHTCDTRLCVNHVHMVLGTAEDNTRDMLERGRARAEGQALSASTQGEARAVG